MDDDTSTFEVEPSATEPPSLVVVVHGRSTVVRLSGGDAVVGRVEGADVRVDDASVSRKHARVRVRGSDVRISDLSSRNGTFVNGARIGSEVALQPGDLVQIGPATLFVHRGGAPLAPAPRSDDAPRVLDVGGARVLVADPAMARVYELLEKLAASSLAVLVVGETGTGKELAASAVHHGSPRRNGKFVSVNCAAIHEGVAEAELFGHAKGAFTGAVTARAGLIEAAHGGTLFLDEIGEMPLSLQAKLLRVLETRAVQRVGEVTPREIDVRVVSATNRDLENEVKNGRFRQDLFFRLSGAQVRLPPLRERPSELPLLAARFAEAARGRPIAIGDDALAALRGYAWPGNVRELRNVMEFAVATSTGDRIELEHLPDRVRGGAAVGAADATAPAPFRPINEEVRELERRRIEEALSRAGGNKTRAAAMIGMPIRTFTEKLRAFRKGE